MQPVLSQDAREVEAAVTFWLETCVGIVLPEKVSDAGQFACVTTTLPKSAHECAHLDKQDIRLVKIRELCASKVDSPVPMEVSAVETGEVGRKSGAYSWSILTHLAIGARDGETWRGKPGRDCAWQDLMFVQPRSTPRRVTSREPRRST